MSIHSIHHRFRSVSLRGSATSMALTCCLFALCSSMSGQAGAQESILRGGNARTAGSASMAGGMFTHGDQAYRVVTAEGYTSATDVSTAAEETIAQAGCFLGGDSCGPACDSGCDSCGGAYASSCSSCSTCGGGYNFGYGYGGGSSCPSCSTSLYGSLEAIYMRKDGTGDYSASPDYFLGTFDYESASRLTIGYIPDCVSGYEFTLTGKLQWLRGGIRRNAPDNIRTTLTAVAPTVQEQLSAFENATDQGQFHSASYQGFSLSNVYVGWDVIKLTCGVRYIDYDEIYKIYSRTATETGFLRSEVDNRMLGLEMGMDLLYPICTNLYADVRGRLGLFANFAEMDLLVVNGGALTAALREHSTSASGIAEVGSGIRYQFCEAFSVRTGFELWYLGRVAKASDQFRDGIIARRSVRAKDDFLIAGINAGFELRY